jgi:predicted DsbA family dithiol-disulfide isomerase
MASLAISLAIISSKFTAAIIEADEFPDIAQRYNVRGVPRTVINETESIEGAVPAGVLMEKILSLDGAPK